MEYDSCDNYDTVLGTSKTKRSILTEKIKDRETTIKSFEEMRTVFESIAMAITEKSQNPTPESEGKIKSAIKKALRKLQDINAFNPDMKKVDSAFRSNLTTTAELMVDYLADKDPRTVFNTFDRLNRFSWTERVAGGSFLISY